MRSIDCEHRRKRDMEDEKNAFTGLLWGGLFSIILWISIFGWMKILIPHVHHYKDWLLYFWQQ